MFYLLKLSLRNLSRHKLRSGLTALGMIVAIVAFGLLRTVVDAWYAGADATSATRLITRNAISLVFTLPLSYRNKIRQVEGVNSISYADWFGGIYIDEKNFFPQFAIEPSSYLDLYPEYVLPEQQKRDFLRDRKGAIAGRRVAAEYGWKIGDVIPLRGTIYPGTWSYVLRGIYRGADAKTDETQFFFHWAYLNETAKKRSSPLSDRVGIYVVGIREPALAAEISENIDQGFKNSLAETLTETEKAFQLGFVAMTEAIITVIRAVSLVVIAIILAVAANTMAMSARERRREHATLRALGFGPYFPALGIIYESLMLAVFAGLIGIALTYPMADFFAGKVGTLFPVFQVSPQTVWLAFATSLLVGLAAALPPAWGCYRMRITDGLSSVG